MTETPAQIAARLGVGLMPGVAVRRVAPGVSGIPQPVWDGRHLITPGIGEYLARLKTATARAARIGRALRAADVLAPPVVTARTAQLARIAEMVSLGHSRADIAGDLGLSLFAMVALAKRNDIVLPPPGPRKSRAKAKADVAPAAFIRRGGRPRNTGDPEVAARRDRVREMHAEGVSAAAMARALGVPPAVIHCDISRMRLRRPPPPGHPLHAGRRATAALRRAAVREGVAAGRSVGQIAASLGLTPQAVHDIRRELAAAEQVGPSPTVSGVAA